MELLPLGLFALAATLLSLFVYFCVHRRKLEVERLRKSQQRSGTPEERLQVYDANEYILFDPIYDLGPEEDKFVDGPRYGINVGTTDKGVYYIR